MGHLLVYFLWPAQLMKLALVPSNIRNESTTSVRSVAQCIEHNRRTFTIFQSLLFCFLSFTMKVFHMGKYWGKIIEKIKVGDY